MTTKKVAYDRESFILVVDDDDTLLKFFKIHLNKFFSKVIVVRNAKEAIATLKEKEIDLVLSDINMPRMDGIQLLQKIRKHDPALPVLLISGALLGPAEEQALAAADGYLRKPFDMQKLHDFITKGLVLREKMLALAELLNDKKGLAGLLQGEVNLEKVCTAEQRARASELLSELQALR